MYLLYLHLYIVQSIKIISVCGQNPTQCGLKITGIITVKGILSFLWVKIVAQKLADSLPTDIQEQIKAAAKL